MCDVLMEDLLLIHFRGVGRNKNCLNAKIQWKCAFFSMLSGMGNECSARLFSTSYSYIYFLRERIHFLASLFFCHGAFLETL